jgi:hypothetical protein
MYRKVAVDTCLASTYVPPCTKQKNLRHFFSCRKFRPKISSDLLGHDAVSFGDMFRTFRRKIVPSSSKVKQSQGEQPTLFKWRRYKNSVLHTVAWHEDTNKTHRGFKQCSRTVWPLTVKAICFVERAGETRPLT